MKCVWIRLWGRVCGCHGTITQWQRLFVTKWVSYWPRQKVLYMLKNRLYLLTPATARDIITPEQAQLIIELGGRLGTGRRQTCISWRSMWKRQRSKCNFHALHIDLSLGNSFEGQNGNDVKQNLLMYGFISCSFRWYKAVNTK